jgi:Toprim domain
MVGNSAGWPIVLAPPNDGLGLAITEGIEDGLSAHEATDGAAWAAGCAARLPTLADVVPAYFEAVTIFADDDASGQRGARELADRLIRRGNLDVFLEGAET